MEWEERFSSIMKETEDNLARVQARLQSSSRLDSRPSPYPNTNPSVTKGRSLLSTLNRTQSSSVRHYSSPGKLSTSQLSSQTSPAMINILIERIEDQAEIITSISNQIQQLQRDKDSQAEIIFRLQDEIAILHERVKEQGIDLPTEQKLMQFKQEFRGEMEDLQSQIRVGKNNSTRDIFTDSSISALARDLKDSKRMDQDERDSLRREIDSLRTRLVKAELDLHSGIAETREQGKTQDKVEKALTSISETQHSQSRSLNQIVDDQQLGAFQFSELRNMLSELKGVISEVENDVLQLQASSGHPNSTLARRKNMKGLKGYNNELIRRTSRSKWRSKPAKLEDNANSKHQDVSSESEPDMSIATAELEDTDSDSVPISVHNTLTEDVTEGDIANSTASLSSLDSDDLLSEVP